MTTTTVRRLKAQTLIRRAEKTGVDEEELENAEDTHSINELIIHSTWLVSAFDEIPRPCLRAVRTAS